MSKKRVHQRGMSTYRGYLSGLSIMQGIAGKRVHNQGTTQHFVSTVMGTL